MTKEDIGLGNVPNVNTNNQTPTFETAEVREPFNSGDTLSAILGQIVRYLADLDEPAFLPLLYSKEQLMQYDLPDYVPSSKAVKDKIEEILAKVLLKTGGTVTGNLVINSGDNDTPNIIFITPSYGNFHVDYCSEYFRIYKEKNGAVTFPFQIYPDGSLYSQKGKIVDASCFSIVNGVLYINV